MPDVPFAPFRGRQREAGIAGTAPEVSPPVDGNGSRLRAEAAPLESTVPVARSTAASAGAAGETSASSGAVAVAPPPAPAAVPGQAVDPAVQAQRDAVWARVRAARNVKRPHTLELIRAMATDIVEIHGDRSVGDDPAVVAGFARIHDRPIVFVGHQKGAETEENVRRNFGMAHPEGYRKAIRAFRLAERFGLPVVTIVDTPGAHPDAASEERGIAEAIARSIMTMTALRTPIVAIITGEGGSGGALAIATADVVLALENAIYSVISPEGCASILWRDAAMAPLAATAMHMTAAEQLELGVVDEVVPEPAGGAQEDPTGLAATLADRILAHLERLAASTPDELVAARYARYRTMGAFTTVEREAPPQRRQDLAGRLGGLIEAGRRALAGSEPVPGSRPIEPEDVDVPLREEL